MERYGRVVSRAAVPLEKAVKETRTAMTDLVDYVVDVDLCCSVLLRGLALWSDVC